MDTPYLNIWVLIVAEVVSISPRICGSLAVPKMSGGCPIPAEPKQKTA